MQAKKNGKLVVITGPMFSGKTSELIRLLERESIAGRKTIMFKPEVDKRYDESSVVTHKGASSEATAVDGGPTGTARVKEVGSGFDAVGIDEAQFFEDMGGLIRAADSLAGMGKTVYVSLLNRSHTGEPFGDAPELLARADYVYSLTAICRRCGNEATFTQRLGDDGKETFGELVKLGGRESYEPRCRGCFIRPDRR
ncbi:MAG: thymidine kinase [Candidatus Micrarchaeota archaeon]|nr:thymidine kinase [Candidatus Micrarchaeota archaeon]